jgi:hypothetical protein
MVLACRVLVSEHANMNDMVFFCQVLASEPANREVYSVCLSGAS